MAYVPCEWYYEHILGDNCDNKCEECFGDKDIRVCNKDFVVIGETLLDSVTIEKGSWWELRFLNSDHALLLGCDSRELRLKRELFDSNFDNFIYNN